MQQFSVHTFLVDATPPVGDYMCGGLLPASTGIDSRLYLRGLILSGNGTRHVLAAVDFCEVNGASQERFVRALAEAAGVEPGHVTLHTTHVHNAPLIDEESHALIESQPPVHNEKFFADLLRNARTAIEQALTTGGTPVGGVAFSQCRVMEFASARRVLDDHGQSQTRWSVCEDKAVRDAPEGRIDPMLDQVVFYDQRNEPVVCLNFYASHPQVASRLSTITADSLGVAMKLFEQSNPTVFPIYFTGCAGNVTAGKYSTANSHRNQVALGLRLFDAMQAAFEQAVPQPLETVGWQSQATNVPLGAIPEGEAHYRTQAEDSTLHLQSRWLAALKLRRLQANINTYPFRISRLDLNDIQILFLPAEMMVEYQLYAKSQAGGPLAVAAYGDSFLMYVPTDEMWAQGGYEVSPGVTKIAPGTEGLLKQAIDAALASN